MSLLVTQKERTSQRDGSFDDGPFECCGIMPQSEFCRVAKARESAYKRKGWERWTMLEVICDDSVEDLTNQILVEDAEGGALRIGSRRRG